MITMLKSAQAPLFSSITPDPSAAKVSPIVEIYPAGKIIYESLRWLTAKYPALRMLRAIAMPDHIHFELFVTEPTEMALGNMIAAFKSTCTNRFREKFPESSIALDDIPLFEDGFNDKIALRSGAKDAFYNYIADNPRRYLVKKLYSYFFFHKLLIEIDGQKCGLYGNIFLLDSPVKSFVKLSRIPERTPNLQQKIDEWEETIRSGGVLVSPFINPAEKRYRDMAVSNGNGIILVADYRFSDRKKPYGELFEQCAEGRLLIVTTEEFETPPKAMNYLHARELNAIAETIAALPPCAARLRRRPS